MAILLNILRAILRALGLMKPVSDGSTLSNDASHSGEVSSAQGSKSEVPHYPYRRRDDFLSTAERNFFRILYQAVGENALICVKVNLADLFYVPSRDAAEHRIYTNKIDRKHVDFVLCDPQTLTPRVGIELDDRSHERTDRKQRDVFVENVFAKAGLPLLRVKVQRSYAVPELIELLHPYLAGGSPLGNVNVSGVEANNSQPVAAAMPHARMAEHAKVGTTPTCPKCGGEMVLRSARGGANAGQKFWGCTNYPRCHGMMAYAATVVGA